MRRIIKLRRNMKSTYMIKAILLVAVFIVIATSGCKKLSLQTSFSRGTTDTLDAHLYKTAWQYMVSRSKGADTTFKTMHDGIIYSGIDTNLYNQPGTNTFFFLNATACKNLWATFLVNGKKGTSFNSYAKADLKNYFLYLIVVGSYSHYNLPATRAIKVQTMAPAGTYTTVPATFAYPVAGGFPTGTVIPSNPSSVMSLYVLDTSIGNTTSYPIVVNMSIATTATLSSTTQNNVTVYTSDLLATNGVVQVMNGALAPTPY
jgi:hypothetical protein